MRLRFGTWNIGCGAKGFHAADPAGMAAKIREHGLDVVCLQEVDRFAKRSRYVDFPEYFGEATGMHAVYCPSVIFPAEFCEKPREYGNLVLSRLAVLDTRHFRFAPSRDDTPGHPAEAEVRTATAVLVDAGTPIWCVGTHLAYSPDQRPSAIRGRQIADLARGIEDTVPPGIPFLLGGDFNTSAGSAEIGILKARFGHATADIGPTWPLGVDREPDADIDHVFYRSVRLLGIAKFDYPLLTDHSLVVAEFET